MFLPLDVFNLSPVEITLRSNENNLAVAIASASAVCLLSTNIPNRENASLEDKALCFNLPPKYK